MGKFFKISGILLSVVFLLMAGLAIFLRSDSGQKAVQKQLQKYLSTKLDTPYSIGRLSYSIPDWVELEDVYFEDTQRDTLLLAGRVRADLDMLALLSGKIIINTIELENGVGKIYTLSNSEQFNYQFLIDAFSSESDSSTSEGNTFQLEDVVLKNTRFKYNDQSAGVDFNIQLKEGTVRFRNFNIADNYYRISEVTADSAYTQLRTFVPTVRNSGNTGENSVKLTIGEVNLSRLYWTYNGEDIGLENNITAMQAEVSFDKLDLRKQLVALNKVNFNRAAIEVFFKQPLGITSDEESKPWIVKIAGLGLKDGNIHYRDNLAKSQLIPNEFNSSDFTFSDSDIELENFFYDGSEIAGNITHAEATERSGLAIKDIRVNFAYTDQLIGLRELYLKTAESLLSGEIILSYDSLDDFLADPLNSNMLVRADQSRIALNDIFRLNAQLKNNPALVKNASKNIQLNGSLKSSQDNFLFDDLRVAIGKETRLDLSGFAGGFRRPEKLKADLNIKDFRLKRDLYKAFIPESVDLSEYQLPELVSINGLVKGDADSLQLNGKLITDFGEIDLNGLLKNAGSDSLRSYQGYLKTTDLAMQKLFVNNQGIGQLTAELQVNGNADLSSIKAEGSIQSVGYQDYTYQDITLDALFEDSVLVLKADSRDENAKLNADFKAFLKSGQTGFNGLVVIQNLNLTNLKISDLDEDISGQFNIDLALEAEDYLTGAASISDLQLGTKKTGDLNGNFVKDGKTQKVKINADYLKFDLTSETGILSLSESLKAFLADSLEHSGLNETFALKGQVYGSPLWESIIPGLYIDEPLAIELSSDAIKLNGNLSTKQLRYDNYVLTGWKTSLSGKPGSYQTRSTLKRLDFGETQLTDNILLANFENNLFEFDFQTADRKNQPIHEVAFDLKNERDESLLEIRKLKLRYQDYEIKNHQLRLVDKKLLTDGLVIMSGNQKVQLRADNEEVDLTIENLNLEPIYRLLYSQDIRLSAFLNGEVVLKNNFDALSGKAELSIEKLTIDDELIGKFQINLPEFSADNFVINGDLKGPSSNADFKGEIGMANEGNIDLTVNLQRLDAALIRAFSAGQVTKASGELFGKIKLSSTFTDPLPEGTLGFRKFDITPTYLGVPLAIDKQQLRFENKNIFLKEFTVKDSTGQALVFDGRLNWSDLNAVSYQLDLKTSDFLLLNTSVEDNDLIYGSLTLDADLRLKGVGEKPSVDGRVKIKKGSDLTFIMPADIETAETQGIVYFVPPDDSVKTTERPVARDTVSAADAFAEVVNEILVAVETDEEAKFTIVVDEINGDQLDFSGTSNLTYGLYPNGQQYLIGSFDLTRGTYGFSLEVFKREFRVLKGSKLTWNGDPYKAELDITAAYEVSTDIQSLKAFGLNSSSYGKVPLDVLLKLTGNIEEPEVNFDVKVSDKAENSIKSLISSDDVFSSLRQNTSEMNQQVFSLILFNRFMSNQFLSFSGSGFSGESVARQSVSKLLTEQLNILAGNLLGGVGLSFGVDSEVLQGVNGSGSRTEFNLGLSQSFLNDRIRVSLGKNFELANSTGVSRSSTEVLDNINIEYLVTPDGRYVAKVYRNNEYQTVLEGFVVETGVGFELRADYDKMTELLNRKQDK